MTRGPGVRRGMGLGGSCCVTICWNSVLAENDVLKSQSYMCKTKFHIHIIEHTLKQSIRD